MKLRKLVVISILAVLVLLPIQLNAAETVHLYLKINGTEIKGESTQTSMGRENSIECTYYENVMTSDKKLTRAETPSQYIVIRKRIDKSSPFLIKALTQNQTLEGNFKFFRPNPVGDGTTQQFYTVAFQGARIESMKQFVPDTIKPESAAEPAMEEITISYSSITYSYMNSAATRTKSG